MGFPFSRTQRLSRTIGLSILFLGALALALVLAADSIYRERSHAQQREALLRIIDLAAHKRIGDLKQHLLELGNRLQGQANLRRAFGDRDLPRLGDLLDQEFHRYFVSAGVLQLEQLFVHDLELQTVAQSSEGKPGVRPLAEVCPATRAALLKRAGALKVKPFYAICEDGGHSRLVALIVLGGLRPMGYLELVADLGYDFARLSDDLGMPVRVLHPNGELAGVSPDWPASAADTDRFLLAEYDYVGEEAVAGIRIQAVEDLSRFNARLRQSRNLITGGALLAMLTTLLGIALLLRNKLGRPLQALHQAAERAGRGVLEPVGVDDAFPEILGPIRSFDQMVHKLGSEIAERTRAEQAMRQARDEVAQALKSLREEQEFSQVTLQSIVDAVIATDEHGRIRYLNPKAEFLTGQCADQSLGGDFMESLALQEDSDQAEPHRLSWQELLEASGDARNNAFRLACNPDEPRLIELNLSSMRDSEGQALGYVAVFRDVTEARKMSLKLAHDATHDALTGLHNRAALEQRMESLLREGPSEAGHALAFMDLDQFKIVNDTCGHAAGDELLRQLTALLLENVSRRDMLARLGGDEFGLVLSQCDIPTATRIANKLRNLVRDFRFVWQNKTFQVGISIGLVGFGQGDDTLGQILSAADTACYLAKDSGGNRISVHNLEKEEVQRRHGEMHWASRITEALDNDRFSLYAQRIESVGQDPAGRRHFEVLVRMRDTQGNLVQPGAFLPAAERFGLISEVDHWIIARTMEHLARLPPDHAKVLAGINLSGHSLTDPGTLDFILDRIIHTGVDPEQLCFEVTETAAIGQLRQAQRFISVLRGTGCSFALDDFGSGLSSFGYLRNLSVDYLKIDGLFVRDVASCPVNRSMVKAINDVGQVMGKQTVAEYVEDEAVLETLREIGVDFAQGFGIARPEPLEDLLARFSAQPDPSAEDPPEMALKL